MTQALTHGEPNLVNQPIEISSETSLSLPESLSLPSNPSISQISKSSFVVPPPLFGQHIDSNRLNNWALNRLQNRHDIHKDIQEHNIQIFTQDNSTLKFETTVKLNNLVHNPLPLAPSNISAQSLSSPFNATKIIYKNDRYTKKTLGYITFFDPYSGLFYTCNFK